MFKEEKTMKKRKLRKYVFGATAMSVLAGGSLALGAQEAQASSVASFNQISVPYVVEIPEIPKVDIGLPSQQTVSQVISAEELEKHNQPQTVSNTPKIATPVSSPTTIPFVTSITIPASSPAVIPSPDVQAVQDSNIEEIKSAFSIRIGNPDSLKVELPDSIPFGEYVKDRVERERIQREIQEDEALRDIKLTIIDDNGKEVDKTIDHSKPWDKQIPQENITVTIIDGESQEEVNYSPFKIDNTLPSITVDSFGTGQDSLSVSASDEEEHKSAHEVTIDLPIAPPTIGEIIFNNPLPVPNEQTPVEQPKLDSPEYVVITPPNNEEHKSAYEVIVDVPAPSGPPKLEITDPGIKLPETTVPDVPSIDEEEHKSAHEVTIDIPAPSGPPTFEEIVFNNPLPVSNESIDNGSPLIISYPVNATIATPLEEVKSAISVRLAKPLEPLKVDVVEKSFSPTIDIQLPEEKNSNPVVSFFGQLIGKIFVAMAN